MGQKVYKVWLKIRNEDGEDKKLYKPKSPVLGYQEKCLERGFIALGYRDNQKDGGTFCGRKANSAREAFIEMEAEDYVVTRLKDESHTYRIGVVQTDKYVTDQEGEKKQEKDLIDGLSPARATYIRKVKWLDFACPEVDMPGAIRGIFVERDSSPIKNISSNNPLILPIIHRLLGMQKKRIPLDSSNFVYALSPDDLEDLMFAYMLEHEEEGRYKLLPSTCKLGTKDIEFKLYDKRDWAHYITCQVKNQQPVLAKGYVDYLEGGPGVSEICDKLYLFSGENEYSKIDEDQKQIEQWKKSGRLVIPTNQEMFEQLKKTGHLRKKLNEHFDIP